MTAHRDGDGDWRMRPARPPEDGGGYVTRKAGDSMKHEGPNQRVSDACDKIRRAGYGMIAHTVWAWWRSIADRAYVNNVLDVEREADRLTDMASLRQALARIHAVAMADDLRSCDSTICEIVATVEAALNLETSA